MEPKIKIAIADRQELFFKSLSSLLNSVNSFSVIAESNDSKHLLDIVKNHPIHVLVLDSEMANADGRNLLDIFKKRFPELKTIILTSQGDLKVVPEFLTKGAASCLSKNCGVETLINAISTVHKEGYFFDKSASKAMLDSLLNERAGLPSRDLNFNDRESDVLKAICDGKTNKQIAVNMNLSASTIDFYRTRIYTKTKCNNIATLLKFALKNGMVELT